MRRRAHPGAGTLLMLPIELRLFYNVREDDGCGPGHDAFGGDRAAWLAARRAWEAEHGMTTDDWFGTVLAQARDDRVDLDEMNRLFSECLTEEDDWEDPRLLPPQPWHTCG